jgi:hypothetical protein
MTIPGAVAPHMIMPDDGLKDGMHPLPPPEGE